MRSNMRAPNPHFLPSLAFHVRPHEQGHHKPHSKLHIPHHRIHANGQRSPLLSCPNDREGSHHSPHLRRSSVGLHQVLQPTRPRERVPRVRNREHHQKSGQGCQCRRAQSGARDIRCLQDSSSGPPGSIHCTAHSNHQEVSRHQSQQW